MAVPSNVVSILNPQIPAKQSIYEASDTQEAKLGTRLQVGERVYYYSRLSTSANVVAGDVLCAPQLIASHQSGILAGAAATTGATTITFTAGTLGSLNQYAEGYIVFASTGLAGCGIYKVKSNPAWATAATNATVVIYDPLPGTLAAAMPVNLVPNMFNAVKVGSEALDIAIGVAPVAVTTGQYFWAQSYGPAAVRHSAGTPAGALMSLATLGFLGAYSITGTLAATGFAQIDYKMPIAKNFSLAATATQANPVFLTILP